MARTNTLGNFLTDVADAIRTAEGSSDPITASDFDTRISALGGGGDISDYYTPTISSGSSSTPAMLKAIKKIPAMELSGTSTAYMFSKLEYVTDIDCSALDTTDVTSMNNMFQNCYRLSLLDLSNLTTANVTSMANMFNGCQALEFLDIRKFTFDSVTSYNNIFNYVPADCLIIVKSQTEKDWILNKKSDFTNIKTVEEYEAE